MTKEVLEAQKLIKTSGKVILYPSSGTGSWEAALVNTLSPGDRVLMFETGQFATLWKNVAVKMGLQADFIPGDWRHGVDPAQVEAKLAEDKQHAIKAVAVVHNETSTGAVSRIAEVRRPLTAGHPALCQDTFLSGDGHGREWGVDVTVSCSQKGLMLPPGLGINAVSEKALKASSSARMPRSYWDWQAMIAPNQTGFFPYTPPTNLLFGLREALQMIQEEGLENVIARHARLGEATRRAVRTWGLEINCLNPLEHSNGLTAVRVPEGHDADALRKKILEFNMSLGKGWGGAGRFRIGHMGDSNDLMLAGT
jgi:alanine-glyoxylate transaminase/serine-glyoxylate transaminase/serine-pyruvate transaminase